MWSLFVLNKLARLFSHRINAVDQIQRRLVILFVFLWLKLTIFGKVLKRFGVVLQLETKLCPLKVHRCIVRIQIDSDIEIIHRLLLIFHGPILYKKISYACINPRKKKYLGTFSYDLDIPLIMSSRLSSYLFRYAYISDRINNKLELESLMSYALSSYFKASKMSYKTFISSF